jgi:hypothetical protein
MAAISEAAPSPQLPLWEFSGWARIHVGCWGT